MGATPAGQRAHEIWPRSGRSAQALREQRAAARACGDHHAFGLGQHAALGVQCLPMRPIAAALQAIDVGIAMPANAGLREQRRNQARRADPAGAQVPAGGGNDGQLR